VLKILAVRHRSSARRMLNEQGDDAFIELTGRGDLLSYGDGWRDEDGDDETEIRRAANNESTMGEILRTVW
jgi:hypothetical protein